MNNLFELQQLTHAALAQYHRWYQVYEVPFTKERIENQKDILADDVEITTSAGTMKGKAEVEDRLKVYEGWLNAHHIQQTKVAMLPDGKISLEADIEYQNIRPDQSKFSYTIHYSTELQPRENDLPLFTSLQLKPTGEVKEFQFEAAYHENRSKSFMHYWLYLMETQKGKSDKFKELLSKDFSLQLSSGQIVDNLDKFDTWFKSVCAPIFTSTHAHKNFSVVDNKDNTFSVSLDFDWKAINIKNENMIAETHHEWLLENNMDDRFAKMKTMKVSIIKPFQVVSY
ncbi:MAG: hypothetical protein ACKVOQ_23660 [Cyclobacteriaceae bacterium]